jgi:hypothetical protein
MVTKPIIISVITLITKVTIIRKGKITTIGKVNLKQFLCMTGQALRVPGGLDVKTVDT